jgi:hypothetical protein
MTIEPAAAGSRLPVAPAAFSFASPAAASGTKKTSCVLAEFTGSSPAFSTITKLAAPAAPPDRIHSFIVGFSHADTRLNPKASR